MSRAERRRLGRTKPVVAVTAGKGGVLKAPFHWHVDLVWYAALAENGNFMWATHYHNIVSNDVVLAVSFTERAAKALSGPPRVAHHVEEHRMCSDEAHIAGLSSDLIKEEGP